MPQYRFIIVLILLLTGIFIAKIKSDSNSANQDSKEPSSIQTTPVNDHGRTLYKLYCMTCHQLDGSGVPNMYPSLKNSDWVNGDKNKLINIVLKGLQGTIVVNGQSYTGNMPRQDQLTDEQIADILSYIRQNFGNKANAVSAEEVAKLR